MFQFQLVGFDAQGFNSSIQHHFVTSFLFFPLKSSINQAFDFLYLFIF